MMYLLLSFLYLFCSGFAFAEIICVTGKSKNTNIIGQLSNAKANSEITKEIYAQYHIGFMASETHQVPDCHECQIRSKNTSDYAAAAKEILKHTSTGTAYGSSSTSHSVNTNSSSQTPKLLFKPECVKASHIAINADSSSTQISCPDGKKILNRSFCNTDEVLHYQNAVISNFYGCLKSMNLPTLSPKYLFKKYSHESGFKSYYSYNSGHGISQLVDEFIADLYEPERGLPFIKMVANSTTPECSIARKILNTDLINRGKNLDRRPTTKKACSFVEIGEGLERNILYGLIGAAKIAEIELKPIFEDYDYLPKYQNDPHFSELNDLLILAAYGPGGRSGARAAIRVYSKKNDPQAFIATLKTKVTSRGGREVTRYLKNYTNSNKVSKDKNAAIASLLPNPLNTEFIGDQGVNACINVF